MKSGLHSNVKVETLSYVFVLIPHFQFLLTIISEAIRSVSTVTLALENENEKYANSDSKSAMIMEIHLSRAFRNHGKV